MRMHLRRGWRQGCCDVPVPQQDRSQQSYVHTGARIRHIECFAWHWVGAEAANIGSGSPGQEPAPAGMLLELRSKCCYWYPRLGPLLHAVHLASF